MAAAAELNLTDPVIAGVPALASSIQPGTGAAARKGPLRLTGFEPELPLRVLLVDPDARGRSILESRFAAEGFEVVCASSAPEALRLLGPGAPLPAVVVADVQLPDTDGFGLCALVRADERTASIPFLLLGQRGDLNTELANIAAVNQFLVKPVYARDVAVLAELWGLHRTPQRTLEASTSEVPLALAVRSLLSGHRSGRLYLHHGRAQLSFREGRIVDATFEGIRGNEAVARMLLIAEGPYTIAFGPALGRAACSVVLEELCRKIFPRISRWETLLTHSVPLGAILAVDFKKLATELEGMPEQVSRLVRLCDGLRTVRDCVLESALGEVTTLEVLNRLYALGVLVALPTAPLGDNVVLFSPRARLFEPEPRAAEERMLQLFGPEAPPDAGSWDTGLTPESERQVDAWMAASPDGGAPVLAEPLARQLEAFRIQTVDDASPELASSAPIERPADAVATYVPLISEPAAQAPAGESLQERRQEALEEAFFSQHEDLARATAAGTKAAPGSRAGLPWASFAIGFVVVLVGGSALLAASGWLSRKPPPAAPSPAVASAFLPAQVPVQRLIGPAAPAEPEPTLADGMALYDQGKSEDAAALLARVVDAHPDDAGAWLMLGLARYDAQDAVGAEDAARRAVELAPANGRAHMLLASIHLDRHQVPEAQRELHRYLELEPTGEWAADAKALLGQ